MPASPWIGSIRTAAGVSPNASPLAQGRSVVEGNRAEARQHRGQVGVLGKLRRRRQGAVGATVEVALEADDLRRLDSAPVGVLACDLDRALVGLRPRVGEEDATTET